MVAAQRYGRPDTLQFEQEHPHAIDRSTAIGRAAVTRDVVHIPDTHEDPEYSWGAAGIMEYRSLLAAPILLEGELIGAMNVVKVAAEPFAPEDTELIRTFADQAAIAIANARLIDAVRRQLEQQQAIGDVLGVVARGEGLDSVFDAVVEAAARLCDAEYGQICIADGDVLRLAGTHGTPPEVVRVRAGTSLPSRPQHGRRARCCFLRRCAYPGCARRPRVLVGRSARSRLPRNARRSHLRGRRAHRSHQRRPERAAAVHRRADRADQDVRRPGGDRDRQRAADRGCRACSSSSRSAISDVLGAVARAEGLESVLQSLVEAACRLCAAHFGEVYLVDEDVLLGSRSDTVARLSSYEYERDAPEHRGIARAVGRVLLTQDVVHIPDILRTTEYS